MSTPHDALSATDHPPPDTVGTPPTGGADLTPLPAGERYQVVRLHAEGGLGAVHLAEDAELHRPVALKTIQDEYAADPAARRRFLREAEVTARLQHPGIVPVYGLTADAAGRPAYAMRFIEGEPLGDAIRRFHAAGARFDSLEFRQLLQRFVAVCNAIAYAHSRGVVHRDLKPANVMLGRFGETLVVDWGVARTIDRSPAEKADGEATVRATVDAVGDRTQMGAAVGTPAYMSPEQAAGRWDVLGLASDVYGLGAVLYTLLTGRPPIPDDTWPAMQQKIQRGDYPAPRQVKSAVPRPLEAVCRKAMALDPAARYASALNLAADVQHWLADEPVAAWREPWAARARRWTRRHARLVTSALAALAVGVVSLGVAAALLTAANERERQAADRERSAKEREAAARSDAETQRDTARNERDRAVAARARTREALDAMTSAVTGDALTTQKTLSAEQRTFLESVLKYYEEFAAEPGEDREGRERLARAHHRLGLIHARLGHTEQGVTVFRCATALYGQLAADFPANPNYRSNAAADHDNLGTLLAGLGQRAEAEAAFQAALAVEQALVADFPANPNYRSGVALTHHNLGTLLSGLGQRAEAEAEYRAALAIQDKLAADFPAVPDYRQDLAKHHHNLGALLAGLGQRVEAEAEYRAALAIQEKLVADFPSAPVYRSGLATSHNSLGILLSGLGQRAEAATAYRAALAVQEKLAADFPAVPDYAVALGGSYCNYGSIVRSRGEPAAALDWFAKAIAILEPVHRAEPRLVTARQFLRNSHSARARALAQLGRPAAALADWDRALALDDGSRRTVLRLGRADTLARTGDAAKTLAAADGLAAASDLSAGNRYDLACVYALAAAKVPTAEVDGVAAKAVAALRRAFAAGYGNVPQMLRDAYLAPLRRRADYAALLWDLADTPPAPAAPR
jgi:serine/threonine-protein kinase